MKILWLKIFETGAARIYGLIIGMAALFLTARILGPERQGTIAAAMAWVTLFASFAGLSLGQVAQYRIQLRRSEDWFPDTFGALALFTIALTVLAYMVAVAMYLLTDGRSFKGILPPVLIIAFIMLPLLIWEQYSSNLLAAIGKLRPYNIAQFLGRTFWLCGIFVLVAFLGMGILGALIAQISGQTIIALVCLATLWKVARRAIQVNRAEVKEMLKGSAKLHLNTVGSLLLAQTSILMLNHFCSKAEVGWYQIAYQMVMILIIIAQVASIVFFSKMAQVGPDRLWPEQRRIGLQVMGIIVLLSAVGYLAAPIAVHLLAGPAFEPSVEIFRFLLPIVLGMSFAQLMTSQWIGRGAFLPTTLATSFTAMANVAANAALIPKFGVMGAVWASLICYVGITILVQAYFAWWCEKKYKKAEQQQFI